MLGADRLPPSALCPPPPMKPRAIAFCVMSMQRDIIGAFAGYVWACVREKERILAVAPSRPNSVAWSLTCIPVAFPPPLYFFFKDLY